MCGGDGGRFPSQGIDGLQWARYKHIRLGGHVVSPQLSNSEAVGAEVAIDNM